MGPRAVTAVRRGAHVTPVAPYVPRRESRALPVGKGGGPCTAAMVYGFRIVEEMIAGLQLWMEDKGYERLSDFQGRAVRNVTDWQHLTTRPRRASTGRSASSTAAATRRARTRPTSRSRSTTGASSR